jgi:DNA-binding MarR family transcriptional regulator
MPSPAEPGDSFGFLINDVARLMRKNFNRRVQSFGLTQEPCRVIVHLSRHEGMRQVELAELLEIQPITLARLLDKLQEHGLIERRRDTEDRRAFCLYLTREAHSVLEKILAIGAATRSDANKDIPQKELDQMYAILCRLKANLLSAEENQRPDTGGEPAK